MNSIAKKISAMEEMGLVNPDRNDNLPDFDRDNSLVASLLLKIFFPEGYRINLDQNKLSQILIAACPTYIAGIIHPDLFQEDEHNIHLVLSLHKDNFYNSQQVANIFFETYGAFFKRSD
jgi:hypothetical protein